HLAKAVIGYSIRFGQLAKRRTPDECIKLLPREGYFFHFRYMLDTLQDKQYVAGKPFISRQGNSSPAPHEPRDGSRGAPPLQRQRHRPEIFQIQEAAPLRGKAVSEQLPQH